MTSPTSFSKDDLEKALAELAFDIHHFRCYVKLHRSGQLLTCSPTVAQAVVYALLLHLRLLIDFFYGPPKQDDVWVRHFELLPGSQRHSNFPQTQRRQMMRSN